MLEEVFVIFLMVGTTSNCLIGQGKNPKTGECQDCPIGYYSSNGVRCENCTICALTGRITKEACSAGRDTTCFCPSGKHLNGSSCIACKICPVGFQQLRGCTHNRDRTCEKCPEGFTTNSTNSKKCFKKVYPKPNNEKSSKFTLQNAIVLGSVLFVLGVVSAICFYLIRKKWRERRIQRINRDFVDEGMEEGGIQLQRLLIDNGNTAALRKVRDLPAHIYQELGIKLNPERLNNWVVLAGHLGFNNDMIGFFKLDPLNATQNVLNDWSTNEGSTVLKLFNILITINRADAANIVEQYVYT